MMSKIRFELMDKRRMEELLPQLFNILYNNMNVIAPTGSSYEEDKSIWLPAVTRGMEKAPRQIILMYVGANLAGYFQYYINEGRFMVEEIQLLPQYESTTLLYSFIRFMGKMIPEDVRYIEAYAHKKNLHSQSLINRLGMELVGENKNGNSYFYRGDYKKVLERFRKV